MKEKTNDAILGVFFIGIGILILYRVVFAFEGVSANQFYRSPAFFPIIVAATLITLSTVMIVRALRLTIRKNGNGKDWTSVIIGRKLRSVQGNETDHDGDHAADREVETGKVAPKARNISIGVVIALVLYTLLVQYVGFLILTTVLIAVLLRLFDVRNVITIVVFSLFATGFTYYLFQVVLDVFLPRGYILRLFF